VVILLRNRRRHVTDLVTRPKLIVPTAAHRHDWTPEALPEAFQQLRIDECFFVRPTDHIYITD
jgi:hypothetical protein